MDSMRESLVIHSPFFNLIDLEQENIWLNCFPLLLNYYRAFLYPAPHFVPTSLEVNSGLLKAPNGLCHYNPTTCVASTLDPKINFRLRRSFV
jgi:hypothetical protein